MRLGGPTHEKFENPSQWAAALKALGYRASRCPVEPGTPPDVIKAYESAARKNDIVIAEVFAWSNPLSRDETIRNAALEKCKKSLALADAIGARCCVNVAGSRGDIWYGPCADDLTKDTFDLIVETVREIIDDVNPKRTFYTIEAMPWAYPDSAESYMTLIDIIDRPALAVHFDPVNLINSPQRYFSNGQVICDFIAMLGPKIKSCHAKDILLQEELTVHLNEVPPGCGGLDYHTFLREINKLPGDIPVMMEHLNNAQEYAAAAEYIRGIAKEEKITM